MATNTLPAVDSQCEHEPKVGRGMCRRCYGRDYYRTKAEYRERLKEQKRKKYAANPEPFLEYSRQHYARNRDEHIARRLEWRRNNPEWARRTDRAWRLRNLDRAAVASQRRRALVANARGDFTPEEWKALLEEFDNRCAYCQAHGVALVIEHMVPLSRGGANSVQNIVPSCAPCNSRKGTKTSLEFLSMRPTTNGEGKTNYGYQ